VNVVIRGEQARLQSLKAQDIEVFIKLADVRKLDAGPVKLVVTAPPGITIIRVIPTEALVTPVDANPNANH